MTSDEISKLPRDEQRFYLQDQVKAGLGHRTTGEITKIDNKKYQWGTTRDMKGGGFSN